MDSRTELEQKLLVELQRVVGPQVGTEFYVFTELSDERLAWGLERLRTLPDGIGFEEMLRQVQQVPPE